VDKVRTDLQEVGCGYMDWTGLAQDRERWRTLVRAVMKLQVLGNFLTSCKPFIFSKRTLHHGISISILAAQAAAFENFHVLCISVFPLCAIY